MKIFRLLVVTALAAGTSACMTASPPVEVTRFHNAAAQPIAPGTVSITSIADETGGSLLEQRTYDAAVMRELQRVGFADAGTGKTASEYVVRVSVEQARVEKLTGRGPVSVGVGGGTGGYGSGVGVGLGFNLGGAPKDLIATQMFVRIARRSNDDVVWEGRANMEAKEGSAASQPALMASKLAQALFQDFPGQSGSTVTVK